MPEPMLVGRRSSIRSRLVILKDHGFIEGWHEDAKGFYVDVPDRRYYPPTLMLAWIEGAQAMGAGGRSDA